MSASIQESAHRADAGERETLGRLWRPIPTSLRKPRSMS